MEMNIEWISGLKCPENGTYCFVVLDVEREDILFMFSTACYLEDKWMLDTNLMNHGDEYRVLAYSIIEKSQLNSILEYVVEECKKKE